MSALSFPLMAGRLTERPGIFTPAVFMVPSISLRLNVAIKGRALYDEYRVIHAHIKRNTWRLAYVITTVRAGGLLAVLTFLIAENTTVNDSALDLAVDNIISTY
jgi:hypothetical protein